MSKKQTNKLRIQLIQAAQETENDELLESAYQILTEQSIWASPEIETAWMEEIARRKKDIDEGRATMIPGEEVFKKAQKIIEG